jgi:hypothetical protein
MVINSEYEMIYLNAFVTRVQVMDQNLRPKDYVRQLNTRAK